MRRNEKAIEDKAIIEKWLKKSRICRVAFNDEPYPYIVPMNYGYKDNRFYFHCAPEGRKIDLIRSNPKVAFEIEIEEELITSDVSCKWTTHFQSIMGTGKLQLIDGIEERRSGLNILMKHHGKGDNFYPDKMLERTMVLQLTIDTISAKQSGDFE